MSPRLFFFSGGDQGTWATRSQHTLTGDSLPSVGRIHIATENTLKHTNWTLRGITSNERYVERSEKDSLLAKQAGLGRAEAKHAALIPIRKNPVWWALTQDERRAIFEKQSHHTEIGLKYLPAIARRLHHCRDLSESEPFDFITWFEYAPENENAFEDLLAALRTSEEWHFVDREIDIRLIRTTR
jgi:chlorite dismutase